MCFNFAPHEKREREEEKKKKRGVLLHMLIVTAHQEYGKNDAVPIYESMAQSRRKACYYRENVGRYVLFSTYECGKQKFLIDMHPTPPAILVLGRST